MCEGMDISSNPPLGLRRKKQINSPSSFGVSHNNGNNNGCDEVASSSSNSSIGDVENQRGLQPPPSSQGQRRRYNNGRTKKISSSSSDAASSSSSSSWRILAHKILHAILTDLDDETLQHPDTELILVVITLIKEAMLGILIAFLAVSLVLFLDHRLLLNIPTARNFRRATFQLMNDQETLRSLEENAHIKLMDMEDYKAMMAEIQNAQNKTKLAQSIYTTRSQDMVQMEQEGKEYGQMLGPLLQEFGFDKFCPDCLWSKRGLRGRFGNGRNRGRITCQDRLDALQQHYNTPKFTAMKSVMKKYSCRYHDENDLEDSDMGSFSQVAKENTLLKDWDHSKTNFFADGMYEGYMLDGSMTCMQRVMYLNERFDVDLDRAGAMVMVENPKCTKSYYGLNDDNEEGNGGGKKGREKKEEEERGKRMKKKQVEMENVEGNDGNKGGMGNDDNGKSHDKERQGNTAREKERSPGNNARDEGRSHEASRRSNNENGNKMLVGVDSENNKHSNRNDDMDAAVVREHKNVQPDKVDTENKRSNDKEMDHRQVVVNDEKQQLKLMPYDDNNHHHSHDDEKKKRSNTRKKGDGDSSSEIVGAAVVIVSKRDRKENHAPNSSNNNDNNNEEVQSDKKEMEAKNDNDNRQNNQDNGGDKREATTSTTNKKLEPLQFCESCHWGWKDEKKVTCGERVEYLMNEYRQLPKKVALMSALERESCMGVGEKVMMGI